MPGILHQPITRKEFFRVAGGSAAMGWLRLAANSSMGAELDPATWHVALLSDTHVPENVEEAYRGFKPAENLEEVVSQVVAASPQAVTLSGDAARLAGLPGDYRVLAELLSPLAESAPVLIGLGNHDHRGNFFRVFDKQPSGDGPMTQRESRDAPQPEAGKLGITGAQHVTGKHVTMLEHPLMRLVMLDSLLYVNKVAGLLGKTQRMWLETILPKLDDRPLVLFVHHTLGDGDGDLLDADRLFRLIAPHAHVKAVFFGHSHQYRVMEREGLRLINLPAVGYNFNDREPVGWVDARFRGDQVSLTLRAIGGNRTEDGKTTVVDWAR